LYFENRKPAETQPPSQETLFGKEKKQFRSLADGSLGELDFSLLLRTYIDEKQAVEAASHWRGGAFKLYENKRDKYPVLSFESEWDSPEAARKFFDLYQRVMKGKWKRFESGAIRKSEPALTLTGSGDSGKFRLSVSGVKVESVEGLR
jgi:hypothetical protein